MLRVLTWNVMLLPGVAKHFVPPRGCPRGWWESRWAHPDLDRAEVIGDRLAAGPWELIVLQELFDVRARAVIAGKLEAKGKYAVFVPPHREKRGHHGLLIASRLPLGRTHFESFRQARVPDALSSKGVSVTELDAFGVRLLVLNAHLQSEDKHADVRRSQLTQMHRCLARHVSASARPTALLALGDMNVVGEKAKTPGGPLERTEEHQAMIAALGGPRDLFRERESAPGFTWDGYGAADGDVLGARRNLCIPWDDKDQQRLDYAMAFDSFRISRAGAPIPEERPLVPLECHEVAVEPFPFERSRSSHPSSQLLPLSDHYGVSATLSVR